ncbi:MAG TPA: hypothetical protein VNH15_07660 [Elusimicrobiota bacterium]|nr:hypothetical protein [Elusimicrobiota bacterium]
MKKIFGTTLCAVFLLGAAGAGLASAQAPAAANAQDDGVGTLGLGLDWTHRELGGEANVQDPGNVTARYWFNDRWGLDVGAGLGFPVISHNSIFAADFGVEPMFALKRSGRSVFYADLQALPSISWITGGKVGNTVVDNGQSGKAFTLSVSVGLGFETALADFPQLRWFAQFNPLSYEHFSPAPSAYATSSSAFGFLGSNTILTLGFHYQF